MHLGISTGGHYMSEDGGATFKASNQGVGAGFVPDPYPEFGQCVHKIVRHEDAPGRLYMQNHGGWVLLMLKVFQEAAPPAPPAMLTR